MADNSRQMFAPLGMKLLLPSKCAGLITTDIQYVQQMKPIYTALCVDVTPGDIDEATIVTCPTSR